MRHIVMVEPGKSPAAGSRARVSIVFSPTAAVQAEASAALF